MTKRRNSRRVAALFAAISLIAAACGSRIDHEDVVAAGSGLQGNLGQASGAAGTLDGSAGDLPEGPADAAGDSTADAAGQPGSVASGGRPGKAGAAGQTGSGQGNGKGGAANGAPIVIGNVGTYSGPVGAAWAEAPRALRAWAAAVNAKGGINGRPVKMITFDDGGDAAKSKSQVQELVEKHKVVAIVSAMVLVPARKAWEGYVQEKKVPVIGGACTIGWQNNPMLFSQCPSPDSWAYGTVDAGAKFGKGKKFGAVFCAEDDTCSSIENLWFNKGYAKRAGLDPKYRATISITQPDYTAECIQARNAGVELFAVMGDPNTVARVASSCRRQNFNPQYLQFGSTVDAGTASKPGMDGAVVTEFVLPFAGLSTPAFREFDGAWSKYGPGKPPGPSATQAWAAAKVFQATAKAAGADISSANLLKVLYTYRNQRFGGVTVPMSYSAKGAADSNCLFLMKVQGGKWSAPNGDRPVCH